jgi:DNA-binding SARP family transcriptional activator
LLWSESSEQNARGSLRQTTHALREAIFDLQGSGLIISHEAFALDPQAVRSDISAVLEAAEAGIIHPLLFEGTPLPERLLYGFEDIDPAFRMFLLIQRRTFGQKLERLLTAAMDSAVNDHVAMRFAAALLQLDPTNEQACRHLMQGYVRLGDTAGALKAYKALWDVLESEYDSEPSAATQDLVVRIKTRAFNQQHPRAHTKGVDPPREGISVSLRGSGAAHFPWCGTISKPNTVNLAGDKLSELADPAPA